MPQVMVWPECGTRLCVLLFNKFHAEAAGYGLTRLSQLLASISPVVIAFYKAIIEGVVGFGFVQLDELLSFAPPKESNQRKGGPTSLKTPHSGAIFRVGSMRRPALGEPFAHIPVRSTRNITPPLGSEEGEWHSLEVW